MAPSSAPSARWDNETSILDPDKPRGPQIASIATQVFGMLGGLVLALIAMFYYPMLLTGTAFVVGGLGGIASGVAASFLIPRDRCFAPGMTGLTRLHVRLGIGVCATGWIAGLAGITNGYAMPVVEREAPMVYKRTTIPDDPEHMSYYVGARVWPLSRDVYEITVPRALYARLDLPSAGMHVPPKVDALPGRGIMRLRVGRGRLGIDWLSGVEDATTSVD